MNAALGFAFQMLVAGGAILFAAYFIRSFFDKPTIPQEEIDAEARRLIVKYGDGAVEAAEMTVQRSQWAKGKSDSRERSARVLKAVRGLIG